MATVWAGHTLRQRRLTISNAFLRICLFCSLSIGSWGPHQTLFGRCSKPLSPHSEHMQAGHHLSPVRREKYGDMLNAGRSMAWRGAAWQLFHLRRAYLAKTCASLNSKVQLGGKDIYYQVFNPAPRQMTAFSAAEHICGRASKQAEEEGKKKREEIF